MNPPTALDGLWRPVYAEMDGEEAPKMMLDKMEIELTGGEYAALAASRPTKAPTKLMQMASPCSA